MMVAYRKGVPARAYFLICYVPVGCRIDGVVSSGQSAFPDLLRSVYRARPSYDLFRPERIS